MLKKPESMGFWDTWKCPVCPWYRDIPNERVPDQQSRKIAHPVYGIVTAYYAAVMDIQRHSCRQTALARRRHRIQVYKIRPETYIHVPPKG